MKAIPLLLVAASLIGCAQDECEVAQDAIQEKARRCELVNAEFFDRPGNEHSRTCEAADADLLSRQARCTEEAPCEALDGTDTAANRAYTDCMSTP